MYVHVNVQLQFYFNLEFAFLIYVASLAFIYKQFALLTYKM